jgi:subtilisin family serine protease
MPNQRRILIRIAAILAILAGSLGNIAVGTAADGVIDGPTAGLIEKAHAEGPLSVIVRLTSVSAQGAVLDEIEGLDASVNVQYDLFPLLALSAGPDALTALSQSTAVIGITEDIPQPPALDATLPVINGDDVQTLGWDGNGQTVAILDTGIDVDHPFFAGRIVSQACYSNSAGNTGESSLCPNGMTV